MRSTIDRALPLRILLIEDDEGAYRLTRDLLSQIGDGAFVLDWESEYATALAAMIAARHDVCLLDDRLGEHDGIEILREARRSGCRAPVILLTAENDRQIDLAAMRAGAAYYLVKSSVDANCLARSIRYALAIDRAFCLEVVDGDADLLRRMVRRFLEVLPQRCADIRAAIERGDDAAVIRHAHSLKGSVSNFGAVRAVRGTAQLEAMGRRGELSDAAATWATLEADLEQVRAALGGLEHVGLAA